MIAAAMRSPDAVPIIIVTRHGGPTIIEAPTWECVAGWLYQGGRPLTLAVDSSDIIRDAFAARLPLDELLELGCATCGDVVFIDRPTMVEIGRDIGSPERFICRT